MSIVGDQSIMVKVSVIIPVYNVEPYLKQCMDSVVGQTLKDIEIICVDAVSYTHLTLPTKA